MLSASLPNRKHRGETNFMSDVRQTLQRFDPATADADLANWGGWWRNRYRQDPDKATRVLADVAAMVKEHRIKRSPGAAAQDLWKRLP